MLENRSWPQVGDEQGRWGEGKLPGDTLLHPDTHPCPQIQIPNENTNMNNKHKYKIQMPSSNRNIPCARKLSGDRTAPIQQIQMQIQNTKSNTNTKWKYTILGKLCGDKGCVLLATLILILWSPDHLRFYPASSLVPLLERCYFFSSSTPVTPFLLHLGVTLLLGSIAPHWKKTFKHFSSFSATPVTTILLHLGVTLLPDRRDICHKHHKQRLCKIIINGAIFHFVIVLLKQFMYICFILLWYSVM